MAYYPAKSTYGTTTTKTPSTTQPVANPGPSPTVTGGIKGTGWGAPIGGTQPSATPTQSPTMTAGNNLGTPSWSTAPRDPNRRYSTAPNWQSYGYGSWRGMVNDPRQQQRLADGKNYAVWGTSPLGQALRQSMRLNKQRDKTFEDIRAKYGPDATKGWEQWALGRDVTPEDMWARAAGGASGQSPGQSGGFDLLSMLRGLVPQQSAAPQNVPQQPGSTQTNFSNLQDALTQQRGGQFWNNWRTR